MSSKPLRKVSPIGTSRVNINIAAAPAVPHPAELLRLAADTLVQRGQQRDSGAGADGVPTERSMAACVAAFNAIEGTTLTERQGWAFMQTLKLTRAAASARNGQADLDSHIDAAGYAALAGECVARGGAQA